MSQDYEWDFNTPLPSIEEVDIELTDWESEPTDSETSSDAAFIASQSDCIEIASHDSSYSPSEAEDLSSLFSSDEENIMDPVSLPSYGESSSSHIFKSSIRVGEYEQITILDEREVEVGKGTGTQFLIRCWVDGESMQKVLDLLYASKTDPINE